MVVMEVLEAAAEVGIQETQQEVQVIRQLRRRHPIQMPHKAVTVGLGCLRLHQLVAAVEVHLLLVELLQTQQPVMVEMVRHLQLVELLLLMLAVGVAEL